MRLGSRVAATARASGIEEAERDARIEKPGVVGGVGYGGIVSRRPTGATVPATFPPRAPRRPCCLPPAISLGETGGGSTGGTTRRERSPGPSCVPSGLLSDFDSSFFTRFFLFYLSCFFSSSKRLAPSAVSQSVLLPYSFTASSS